MQILGRTVKPLKLGLCSAFAAALVMLAMLSTQQHINEAARERGWVGSDEAELQVLDGRMGYTADDVRQLFSRWGPQGREWYLICEAIDAFAFCPAYGLGLTVLVTFLAAVAARKTGVSAVRQVASWPLLLAGVDWVENALQVLLLQTFAEDAGGLPPWWDNAAAAASIVNQLKWWIVRLGAAATLLVAAAALAPR